MANFPGYQPTGSAALSSGGGGAVPPKKPNGYEPGPVIFQCQVCGVVNRYEELSDIPPGTGVLNLPLRKYSRPCKGVTIDVYDVLQAFEVTNPALQHLIKKALCAGLRGHKDLHQDLNEILESAKRAIELESK